MDSPRNHDDESSVSSISDEEDWEDCYTPGEPYSDAIDKIERNNLDGHRFLAIVNVGMVYLPMVGAT